MLLGVSEIRLFFKMCNKMRGTQPHLVLKMVFSGKLLILLWEQNYTYCSTLRILKWNYIKRLMYLNLDKSFQYKFFYFLAKVKRSFKIAEKYLIVSPTTFCKACNVPYECSKSLREYDRFSFLNKRNTVVHLKLSIQVKN